MAIPNKEPTIPPNWATRPDAPAGESERTEVVHKGGDPTVGRTVKLCTHPTINQSSRSTN